MTEAKTRTAKVAVQARMPTPEMESGATPEYEMPKFEMPMFDMPKFEMPKFEMPKMEVPAAFREIAEKNIAQAKDGYERMKAVAEETTDMLEDSYATASKGATEYTLKAMEAARDNINATFDFATNMLMVKSVSEAVELSSAHARKQFEALATQTKDLAALAQKVAVDSTEPLKAGLSKTFSAAA